MISSKAHIRWWAPSSLRSPCEVSWLSGGQTPVCRGLTTSLRDPRTTLAAFALLVLWPKRHHALRFTGPLHVLHCPELPFPALCAGFMPACARPKPPRPSPRAAGPANSVSLVLPACGYPLAAASGDAGGRPEDGHKEKLGCFFLSLLLSSLPSPRLSPLLRAVSPETAYFCCTFRNTPLRPSGLGGGDSSCRS